MVLTVHWMFNCMRISYTTSNVTLAKTAIQNICFLMKIKRKEVGGVF